MPHQTHNMRRFHKEPRVALGFRALAREFWHRRKHGFTRRPVRRLHQVAYALLGSSIVSNTSGRALGSGSSSQSLCLPT